MESAPKTRFWISPIPEKVLNPDTIHAVKIVSLSTETEYGRITYKKEGSRIVVYVKRADYNGERKVDILNSEEEIPDKSREIGVRLACS